MAKRDSFLLRADPVVLEAIRRWADDEMRSMNAQIEFVLRSKLKDAGRLPQSVRDPESPTECPTEPNPDLSQQPGTESTD